MRAQLLDVVNPDILFGHYVYTTSVSLGLTEHFERYAAAMATTVGTGNFQAQIAKAVGLDEIVVLPGTDPATDGGVIQVGKRIGDRIYVVLEQRLSTAQNVLRVNYQFARDWSLRLESGETDAVDVFYSLSFD